MRFMIMHKVDAKMEAGAPPEPRIIEHMGALVQASLKDGTFITGAGLQRSAKRVRVKRVGDSSTVQPGPYAGENELLASYAMIKAPSLEAALPHVQAFLLAGESPEIEVGPVVEPWDLGVMPKPPGNIPVQLLLLSKGNSELEAGGSSPQKRAAALGVLSASLGDHGVILASGALTPSAQGKRSAPSAGKRTWVDGPFAESKELIAGFCVLERASLAEAIAWADGYGAILTDSEIDVRELLES
jgi:hypothetical protein